MGIYSATLVRTNEWLYDTTTGAVQMNGDIQGCLLSPSGFITFFVRIMSDSLEEHYEKVSILGINITYLQFADDICSS